MENDLGFHLYRAVERTKLELSQGERSTFRFDHPPARFEVEVNRDDFETWIEEEIESIAACVDMLCSRSKVGESNVDRVFMTGGSSFVPAVRDIFVSRFGAERIRSGGELTSVASGLALRALAT